MIEIMTLIAFDTISAVSTNCGLSPGTKCHSPRFLSNFHRILKARENGISRSVGEGQLPKVGCVC